MTNVMTQNVGTQPPKPILMITEAIQTNVEEMKMLSSYLLKKKLWMSLKHLTTWVHQRWTKNNLAMLQKVKIKEGLQVVIANPQVRVKWWGKKVDLGSEI